MINEIKVMDLTGRLLNRQYVHSENTRVTLDVSKLPVGYYLLWVDKKTGPVTLPFIKQ